jgi:hypothetical protein
VRHRAGELRDPEFDAPLPPEESPCRGGRCDGTGYVRVDVDYVNRHCPFPSLPEPINDLEQMQYDAIMRETAARRSALANSVYPCASCNPTQFAAWYAGEWSKPPKATRRRKREATPDDPAHDSDAPEPEPAPSYESQRMDLA